MKNLQGFTDIQVKKRQKTSKNCPIRDKMLVEKMSQCAFRAEQRWFFKSVTQPARTAWR
jgi:hypothetical protein